MYLYMTLAFLGFHIQSKSKQKIMTTDIFDNKILCNKCNVEMKPLEISKNGFVLRAIECPKCTIKIIHPKDEQEFNNFQDLKKKQFNVKMRFVGNSYAVSIPKEIVNFMKEQEKVVDDMVRLCFEEFGRLRLDFGCHNNNCHDPNINKHIRRLN
jgi:hypothetical protein